LKRPAASLYDGDFYLIKPEGSGFRKLTNAPEGAEFARFPKGIVSVTLRNDQPFYKQSQASAGVFIVYVAGAAVNLSLKRDRPAPCFHGAGLLVFTL
jgi:hypothetical protein